MSEVPLYAEGPRRMLRQSGDITPRRMTGVTSQSQVSTSRGYPEPCTAIQVHNLCVCVCLCGWVRACVWKWGRRGALGAPHLADAILLNPRHAEGARCMFHSCLGWCYLRVVSS